MYIIQLPHVRMVEVTLTELRRRLFELADSALATGKPVDIRRNGQKMVLKRASDPDPRDRLLAYLELAEAPRETGMSKAEKKLFDLSDVLEMHDPDQPELYD